MKILDKIDPCRYVVWLYPAIRLTHFRWHVGFSQIAYLPKMPHRRERDKRLADRLKAIVLLGNGWSVSAVAEALLVDEKTIRLRL